MHCNETAPPPACLQQGACGFLVGEQKFKEDFRLDQKAWSTGDFIHGGGACLEKIKVIRIARGSLAARLPTYLDAWYVFHRLSGASIRREP